MSKDVINAINVLKKYFQNPDNFKTSDQILQGVTISNWMDMITDEFVNTHVRPELEKRVSNLTIVDIGAKA